MEELKERTMENLRELTSKLSEPEMEKLCSFSEGMLFMKNKQIAEGQQDQDDKKIAQA